MKLRGLTPYKIGLSVVGLFTAVMLIVILVQASGNRTDTQTYKAATKAADKLNQYADSSQEAPASLEAAGVTKVPSTITYTKLSYTSYKFCVTYKNATGFSATQTGLNVLFTGGRNASEYESPDDSTNSYLYVDATHKKGQNCQTINLADDGQDDYTNDGSQGYGGSSSSTNDSTSSAQATEDAADQACYDQNDSKTFLACEDKAQAAYDKATGADAQTLAIDACDIQYDQDGNQAAYNTCLDKAEQAGESAQSSGSIYN